MALWLASCGGGGSPASPVGTTCSLALTTYADGGSSGIDIQQNGPTTAVARPLNGCEIGSLQSARLRLCIAHSQISELTARITQPITSASLGALTPETSFTPAEISFCSLSQGTIYTVAIPVNALSPVQSLNTSWNVAVIDQTGNNQSGKFVGWSLVLTGVK